MGVSVQPNVTTWVNQTHIQYGSGRISAAAEWVELLADRPLPAPFHFRTRPIQKPTTTCSCCCCFYLRCSDCWLWTTTRQLAALTARESPHTPSARLSPITSTCPHTRCNRLLFPAILHPSVLSASLSSYHGCMSIDVSKVWSGLDDSQRRQRWPERIDKKLLEYKFQSSALQSGVKDSIDMNVQPAFFTHLVTPLSPQQYEDIRVVLRMDAAFNHRTSYIDGYAQLTARLLALHNNDTHVTFATLQAINQQLKPLQASKLNLRNDALTLASLLTRDAPELTAHFNSVGFDVCDLSDLMIGWLPAAFGLGGWPAELVLRVVDVLLLDSVGCAYLFAVLYGMLRVHSKVLQQQSADGIFQFLVDLPASMSKQQVSETFVFAYKQVRSKSEQVSAERRKRDWLRTVERPGPIMFSADVGDVSVTVKDGASSISGVAGRDLSKLSVASGGNSGNSSPSISGASTPVSGGRSLTSTTGDVSATSSKRPPPIPPGMLSTVASAASSAVPSPSNAADTASAAPLAVLDKLRAAAKETDINKIRPLLQQIEQQLTPRPPPLSVTHSPNPSLSTPTAFITPPAVLASFSTLPPFPPTKLPFNPTIRYSDLPDYQSYPCTQMEGYLLKSRQADKFINRNTNKKSSASGGGSGGTLTGGLFGVSLHRRLFVLEGEWLSYWKGRREGKPARDECLCVRWCWVEEMSEKEFGQWGFGFEIRMRTKGPAPPPPTNLTSRQQGGGSGVGVVAPPTEPMFVLFANSAKERQMWMDVLKRATQQV